MAKLNCNVAQYGGIKMTQPFFSEPKVARKLFEYCSKSTRYDVLLCKFLIVTALL